MKIRTLMTALAAAFFVAGVSSAALAHGHHGGRDGSPCGCGYASLAPEKQAAVEKLMQKHEADTAPLREELQAKRLELSALSRNPDTKPEVISKLAQETAKLTSQLRAARSALRSQMAQETGIGIPEGRNGGRGLPGRWRDHR